MNAILAIPLEFRLFGLFVIGVCAGSLANLAACQLAWHPRPISPWTSRPRGAPPRRWDDRLPVVGWLGLRRESPLHGPGFWIQPMLVEILLGVGLPALYGWEIGCLGLIAPGAPPPGMAALHVQYVCHLLLILLMLVGSLVDLNERIIPDSITVPGTLLGLAIAALYPWSLLPVAQPGAAAPDFLHLASPFPWPVWLDGFPRWSSLGLGLGCWWLWCFALMPRTWYARHGWRRAMGLMLARLRRQRATRQCALMGLAGSIGIAAVWLWGGAHWQGLLSALAGMVGAGGLVWAVRIIGTAVLRREAMGFGDVTLMAMIGTFLGWQACLMVFFLAPFAALLFGVATLILRRETEIPYGPFLCAAAVAVIARWAALWTWAAPIFHLGPIVPAVLAVCLILMIPLLFILRLVREVLTAEGR